jgi:hypothetical protein
MGLHAEIQRIAETKHINPARKAQRAEFSIAVRDLMREAEEEGLSTVQRVPAFCKSIQAERFLKEHGVSIVRKEGPASGLSTTVVLHYAFRDGSPMNGAAVPEETAEERAHRLAEKLRGMLSDEIEARGGAESFLRWVRSEDELA